MPIGQYAFAATVPVVDGVVLTDMPRRMYARGTFNAEAMMTGIVEGEEGGFMRYTLHHLLGNNPHLGKSEVGYQIFYTA